MHLTHALALALALPALTSAQDIQKPLIEQATSWLQTLLGSLPTTIPTAVPTALRSPVPAAAAALAAKKVTPLTMANYERELTPDPATAAPAQEWMVFVTGGNKTCGGHCLRLERAFNETATLLAADPTAPSLAILDCDAQGALCSTWMAKPPTIWHIRRVRAADADTSSSSSSSTSTTTTIHVNYFNVTHSTAGDMVALHSSKKYEDGIRYEGGGWFDPFDGPLARWGVNKGVGYALYGVGLVPSWAFMIVVSMVSRTIM